MRSYKVLTEDGSALRRNRRHPGVTRKSPVRPTLSEAKRRLVRTKERKVSPRAQGIAKEPPSAPAVKQSAPL